MHDATRSPRGGPRSRLDVTDIGRQLAFWQSLGFVDKRIAPADLIDVSFIGEPICLRPQVRSWLYGKFSGISGQDSGI